MKKIGEIKYVFKQKHTEYYILAPKQQDKKTEFAIDELKSFLREIFQITITVSNVKLANGNYITFNSDLSGTDFYHVYTQGYNYVIEGRGSRGVIYGVYAFLSAVCKLTFYTSDFYKYNFADVTFVPLDFSRTPDIAVRSVGVYGVHDETPDSPILPNVFRMGLCGMADGWGMCNHSHFKVLPKEKYFDAHKEWYSKSGGQLCLTNGEMRKEFIERLTDIVEKHPGANYFSVAQMDGNASETFCTCDDCKKKLEEYGGSYSMMMLEFTNYVVCEVNERLQKKSLRKPVFVMYAYQFTVNPPVKKINGKYIPLVNLNIEDNVAVMFAPLCARSDISFFNKKNYLSVNTTYVSNKKLSCRDVYLGWRSIVKKIFVWEYSLDNGDWLVPFNVNKARSINYKNYKKLGVEYIFSEGAYRKNVGNFSKLQTYLTSCLAWNVNENIKKETDRFFQGYYGSACSCMKKYYEKLMKLCKKARRNRPSFFVAFDDYAPSNSPQYWRYKDLLAVEKLFEKALEKSEGVYKAHVLDDGMCIYYLLLILYSGRLDNSTFYKLSNVLSNFIENNNLIDSPEGFDVLKLKKIIAYKNIEKQY